MRRMSYNPLLSRSPAYQVNTPVFEGPLDLLLQLIERAELDITRLSLAQVTDQFLEHIKHLADRGAEEVSAFLIIAARLLQIKSEALLPRPPVREPGEEDPGEALAMQLIAYKRYRQIADLLAHREESGLRTYLRIAPAPRLEGTIDLSGLGISDLFNAAQIIFSTPKHLPLSTMVAPPRITIREKILHIAQVLVKKHLAFFSHLVSDRRSRLEIVVTFLAVLELIKRRLVNARQERLFGEITLEAASEWQLESDFQTEFGE